MNFETAIIAEFATQHLMKELKLSGPVQLHLGLGYDLQLNNVPKWKAIQKTYKSEIAECLKNGSGNTKGFKYKSLSVKTRS